VFDSAVALIERVEARSAPPAIADVPAATRSSTISVCVAPRANLLGRKAIDFPVAAVAERQPALGVETANAQRDGVDGGLIELRPGRARRRDRP